jgi:hypothetical protein
MGGKVKESTFLRGPSMHTKLIYVIERKPPPHFGS